MTELEALTIAYDEISSMVGIENYDEYSQASDVLYKMIKQRRDKQVKEMCKRKMVQNSLSGKPQPQQPTRIVRDGKVVTLDVFGKSEGAEE